MTRLLVLGSDGFIGRATCRLVDSIPGGEPALRHVHRLGDERRVAGAGSTPVHALDLVQASVADVSLLLGQTRPDVVVNCVGATAGDAATFLATNVRVVATLLRALADHPEVHFIQIGSAAEYGLTPVDRAVRESDLPTPINDYGRTKLTATRLVLGAAAQGRVHATVLRVFNPIGRGAPVRTLLGSTVARLEQAIAAGEDHVHFGHLSSSRDYIAVGDVASAIVAAGTSQYSSGALLNIGRGEALQSRKLVTKLAAIAGFSGEIVEDADGSSRSNALSWQQADISASRHRLDWSPTLGLDQALEDLWAYRPVSCNG